MNHKEFKESLLKKNPKIREEYYKRDLAFEIGKMIVEARVWTGITKKKLAELMDTKQPSIARVEGGNKLPTLRFLENMARAFDTDLILPRFGFLPDTTIGNSLMIFQETSPSNQGIRVRTSASEVESSITYAPTNHQ